jgi:hypothetical protein
MYDDPYNSKTLPLVWKVVACSLVVTSGCIGNNLFLAFLIKLTKNNTNDVFLSHGGETHLRVSQSQVAEIVT